VPLQSIVGPWPLFLFHDFMHSRHFSLDGGSACRNTCTYTYGNTTQNKRTKTTLPPVWFEPTTPCWKRRGLHSLDWVAAVIGWQSYITNLKKILEVGWEWVRLACRPIIGLLYKHRMRDEFGGLDGNENWQSKQKKWENTCLSVPLKTPWPLDPSELYRLSDRHLSTKFSANFCG
jgi:hypothetical protein